MKKILIDDSLTWALEQEKYFFLRRNIKIFAASTAEELLAIHKTENTDLIIIPLETPTTNGSRVCSAIRKDNVLKNVSVVVVCDKDALTAAGLETCDANAFLKTPLDTEELFYMIEKFLSISRRVKVRAVFQVSVKGKVNKDVFFANSDNISSSGILFETDAALEKGDKIICSLFIGDKLIDVGGEVIRIEKGGITQYFYGVQFYGLSDPLKATIEEFVAQHRSL